MKLFKIFLVTLVFLASLVVAQPSWADRPKLTNSPEYAEVTQALDTLLKEKAAPDESGYKPEEIEQKIGELRLQKYIMETARNWGQCRNETGKTLAVYAHKPKKSYFPNAQPSELFYLADGEVTDDEWSCDGVYLPGGAKIAGGQELTEAIALKLVTGSQLVATTNPETGAVEFNIPPAKVFKSGESNLSIPALSQTDIDAQAPNAPVD